MATVVWQGGTTAVTQRETFALQNDFNNSETELKMTMTAEDGSTTQTVTIDPSGSRLDEELKGAGHQCPEPFWLPTQLCRMYRWSRSQVWPLSWLTTASMPNCLNPFLSLTYPARTI